MNEDSSEQSLLRSEIDEVLIWKRKIKHLSSASEAEQTYGRLTVELKVLEPLGLRREDGDESGLCLLRGDDVKSREELVQRDCYGSDSLLRGEEESREPTHLDQTTLSSSVHPTGEHRPSSLSNLRISVSESVPDDLLPLSDGKPPGVLNLSERKSLKVDCSSNGWVDVSSSKKDDGEGSRSEGQGEEGCLTDVAVKIKSVVGVSEEREECERGWWDERRRIGRGDVHELSENFDLVLVLCVLAVEGTESEDSLDSNGDFLVSSSFEKGESDGSVDVLAAEDERKESKVSSLSLLLPSLPRSRR